MLLLSSSRRPSRPAQVQPYDRAPGEIPSRSARTAWPHWAPLLLGLLTLFLSPAAGLPVPAPVPAPGTSAESRPEILVATVHSVDSASGTVSLLTGRGHALRVVQISLPRGAAIMRRGSALGLADLKRGAIVRIRFSGERTGGIRQAIEIEVQDGG